MNSFNKFTLTAMVDKLRDNFAATSTGAGLWRMNSVSGKLLLTLPQSMRLQTNCQRIRSNQCHNTELWSGNWKLPGDRPSNCTHHVLWSAIEPERLVGPRMPRTTKGHGRDSFGCGRTPRCPATIGPFSSDRLGQPGVRRSTQTGTGKRMTRMALQLWNASASDYPIFSVDISSLTQQKFGQAIVTVSSGHVKWRTSVTVSCDQ